MKGDIAFAGFVLTPDEWHLLDDEARAELIAITNRQADPWLPTPGSEPLAEGSGPFTFASPGSAGARSTARGSAELIAEVVEREPATTSDVGA